MWMLFPPLPNVLLLCALLPFGPIGVWPHQMNCHLPVAVGSSSCPPPMWPHIQSATTGPGSVEAKEEEGKGSRRVSIRPITTSLALSFFLCPKHGHCRAGRRPKEGNDGRGLWRFGLGFSLGPPFIPFLLLPLFPLRHRFYFHSQPIIFAPTVIHSTPAHTKNFPPSPQDLSPPRRLLCRGLSPFAIIHFEHHSASSILKNCNHVVVHFTTP